MHLALTILLLLPIIAVGTVGELAGIAFMVEHDPWWALLFPAIIVWIFLWGGVGAYVFAWREMPDLLPYFSFF